MNDHHGNTEGIYDKMEGIAIDSSANLTLEDGAKAISATFMISRHLKAARNHLSASGASAATVAVDRELEEAMERVGECFEYLSSIVNGERHPNVVERETNV